MFDSVTRHLRYAVRLLGRAPLFTLTAVASLAIGIGANTTIFTAANALLLAPARGIQAPDRLVDIGAARNGQGFDTMSFPAYEAVRDRNQLLAGAYAVGVEPRPVSLARSAGAERLYGQFVSGGFFDVLGVKPLRGAFFHQADERVGVPLRKVVLSHACWQREFAGDPQVVGSTITLNGTPFDVAAVAPADFRGTTVLVPDLWLPLTSYGTGMPDERLTRMAQDSWLVMGARMKDGVTIDQVRAELSAIGSSLARENPGAYAHRELVVEPSSRLPGEIGQFVAPFIAVLMALVGLVLLVACTNLAGLMLARTASRSREMAVRLALGASRRNLVGQLLTEGLVLFVAGGAAGLILARWMTGALIGLLPALPVPISLEMPLDWRVLAFTAALALVAGVFTGLAPALHGTRMNLVPALKDEASAPSRQRLRHLFVAGQMALCLLLMVVAGLFLRSLGAAVRFDPGFTVAGIDVASFDLSLAGYTATEQPTAAEALRERLAAIPGVSGVAIGAVVPLAGDGLGLGGLTPRGATGDRASIDADWNVVSPEFLPTLDIPIVAGRNFTDADRAGTTRVGIVNQRFARAAWPNASPIGQVLNNEDGPITVVGVARDAKYRSLGDQPRDFIYVAAGQQPFSRLSYFMRRDPRAASVNLAAEVRAAVRDFNRNLPVVNSMALSEYANLGLTPERLAASVAGSLGAVALLLAAIGIYGLTAFAVTCRTREIGVRMALGANRRAVVAMVVGQSLRLAAVGAGVGLLAAAGVGQLLSSLLFGVSPLDPIAFGATAATLTAVAVAATLGPALRASRIDPLRALRQE
jgi:putative ABC transport system permease protein